MKTILLLLIVVGIAACKKQQQEEPDTVPINMTITRTNAPIVVIAGQPIKIDVRVSGFDLCHRFTNFEMTETGTKQFEIKAKGTYPNAKKGDIVCLQAIYNKDTSVTINNTTAGRYVFKFFNNNLLFKSDTVIVN